MDTNNRKEATAAIWVPMSLALIALFISGGMANGINGYHFVIAIVLASAGLVGVGFIWSWGAPGIVDKNAGEHYTASEKAKRDRIENALKDLSKLSDEELMILKQRLSTGEINDDMLHEYLVGDDGELVNSR